MKVDKSRTMEKNRMKAFRTTAEFYEIFSDDHARILREGPLLERILRQAPGNEVADLACGTGIHAEFLANLDASVTAFDLSEEMVSAAKKKRPHERIDYRQGDMKEIAGRTWDLIICLGNSLSLLADLSEVERTFRAVKQCLSPNGVFLVQVINYLSEKNLQPRHRIERGDFGDNEIVAVKNLVPHGDRTLLSLSFFSLGTDVASVSETGFLLNLSEKDLVWVSEKTGLEIAEVLGSFDGSAYDSKTSPDLIMLLRNRPGV